jgi:hypothetical protein
LHRYGGVNSHFNGLGWKCLSVQPL